ncbi:MAG: holo-ACP synthase [Alphaproteobacteria bacterium]|nr:holo-ACP synthase [Alphaproteobacteria bacterium]
MIIGIGNDLVEIKRIERALDRHGKRFEDRCFTLFEQSKAGRRRASGLHVHVYAKRFAAKEACVKALGTGFTEDIFFKDIGVEEDGAGRPLLKLTGGAQKRLQELTPEGMEPVLHLSLSDDSSLAQAFVVIEARFR